MWCVRAEAPRWRRVRTALRRRWGGRWRWGKMRERARWVGDVRRSCAAALRLWGLQLLLLLLLPLPLLWGPRVAWMSVPATYHVPLRSKLEGERPWGDLRVMRVGGGGEEEGPALSSD